MKKINPDLLFEDLVHNPADSLGDSERFIFPCGDGALWGQVMRDSKIYDLSGRQVVNPTRGIYIINGRKVYVK